MQVNRKSAAPSCEETAKRELRDSALEKAKQAVRTLGSARHQPRQRRFSSKRGRPAAERQASDGRGDIRRKIKGGHLLARKTGNGSNRRRRQGPAKGATHVAVRASLRRTIATSV